MRKNKGETEKERKDRWGRRGGDRAGSSKKKRRWEERGQERRKGKKKKEISSLAVLTFDLCYNAN